MYIPAITTTLSTTGLPAGLKEKNLKKHEKTTLLKKKTTILEKKKHFSLLFILKSSLIM